MVFALSELVHKHGLQDVTSEFMFLMMNCIVNFVWLSKAPIKK